MAARELSSLPEGHENGSGLEQEPEVEPSGSLRQAPGSDEESYLSEAGSANSSGTTNINRESESESDGPENRPPLWYLVLHQVEYAVWTRDDTQLMTHAIASFEQVNGPNLIANGVWEILEELDFQFPLENIQIGRDQYIIEARQVLCLYHDRVIRPVVLVHLIDVESGREQMLALTECDVRPRTETWTLEEARDMLRPRLLPFSGAEVMASREQRAKAKGAPLAKAPTVPPPPGYPASASTPVPKAPSAKASLATASGPNSQASNSRANAAENHDRPEAAVAKSCFGPRVLVDSGANEVIRPRPEGFPIHKCRRTHVALASGDLVDAWRTRDGELMIGDEELDQDADWILSVRRLRGVRGAFIWDEMGPRVTFPEGETILTVHCFEQNGLPYISWEDFRPIRVLLARDWKSKGNARVMKIEDRALQILDYMPTVDAIGQVQEECIAIPPESIVDVGEQRAKELCAKTKVSFDEVWSAVQLASLVNRRTDRMKQIANDDAKTLPLWTFGMFVHGGVMGVTSESRKHPWLTQLLCKMIRQQHPDLEFLSVSIAINLVFRPHRDRNSLERESVVIGLSRFQGGQLWIEGLPGEKGNTAVRYTDKDGQPKAGKLH